MRFAFKINDRLFIGYLFFDVDVLSRFQLKLAAFGRHAKFGTFLSTVGVTLLLDSSFTLLYFFYRRSKVY